MAIELNRKLTLEGRGGAPDGAGGFNHGWVELGTLWGRIEPRTGRAISHDEVQAGRMPVRIVIRATPIGAPSRPRPGHRLVEGTRVFTVHAVGDYDVAGRFLAVFADEETAA